MSRWLIRIALLIPWLCPAGLWAQARVQPASAAELIRQINSLRRPTFDASKFQNPADAEEYQNTLNGYHAARSELVRTFVENYPNHPQAMQMLILRWESLRALDDEAAIEREAQNVLANRRDARSKTEALHALAEISVSRASAVTVEALAAIQMFIDIAPKDLRGAELLDRLSRMESPRRNDVLKQIVRLYPNTDYGKRAQGYIRRSEGVGKPFELNFTDAISGKTVSIQRDLKGRVVVIDFWATWCGPCVDEMPELKRIHAKYRDRGVVFIGVSLDYSQAQGGLKALKDYVSKNEILWPQFYQGKGFESDFSAGWGVNAIPTTFLIDKNGLLATTEARGLLDVMIPQLIEGKKIDTTRRNPLAGQ